MCLVPNMYNRWHFSQGWVVVCELVLVNRQVDGLCLWWLWRSRRELLLKYRNISSACWCYKLSVLAANTNHPLPHTLPHTDALTCMHVHVRKLNSCITLIWQFFTSDLNGQAMWLRDSAWGLFNPLGFSQNASATIQWWAVDLYTITSKPPPSLCVSLYLHMSKKQELWHSLAMFIPASKCYPWSLHLLVPLPLLKHLIFFFFFIKPPNESV